MVTRLRCLVLLTLCLGLAGAAAAQNWDLEIPSTSTPPVIDGQVDGVWSIASVQDVTVVIEGSIDSPADNSVSWRVLWDGDNLYMIVDVNDDSLLNDSANAYQDDSVEFYFDGGNSKGGSPLAEDDRQYTFGWDTDEIQGTNQEVIGVEHAQVNTEAGWRIEMKFPWSSLTDNIPGMGDLIGIDCFYNDDDDGADTRESQIATFADDGGDWQNPADWGTAILVKGSQEKASGPSPEDGAQGVSRAAVLEWSPGVFARTHDVYFGTVLENVSSADRANPMNVLVGQGQSGNDYDPDGLLEFGQTYYWRIDEVNGAPDNTIFTGEVWSFTAEAFANPIEGISATSNAGSDGISGPEKTVDGSGLNEADEHSINAAHMWLGVPEGADPVWVQYEFDRVYKLHEMLVWNYNSQFELILGFGLKDVTVEYSENGTDWTVLGDVQFAQATARSSYTANTTVDFNGVGAKYVRFTVNSGWGMMGQFGLSEVRFLVIPVQAGEPEPADDASDVDPGAVLGWQAGREAVSHEIYLNADEAAVADGTALIDTIDDTRYAPAGLEFGSTYFWKINEVNEAEAVSLWEGDVWSFATQEYAVIDGFESYTDDLDAGEAIFQTWIDGWEDPANGGSQVGYADAPFAETSVVNSGVQSMPLAYDNSASPFYSETYRQFSAANWNTHGADRLVVSYRGYPVAFQENADGTITMGAGGVDIWDLSDEFRFVYQRLSGDGSILARGDSLVRSDGWAKAGVMIREALTPTSTHATVVVTPDNGASFQRRPTAGAASANTDTTGLAAPHWVKVTRTGNTFTAQESADGVTWVDITPTTPVTITMATDVYIGLALTSHNVNQMTSAQFSNVSTTGTVTGQWQAEAIGVEQPANAPASLYVAVEDSTGRLAVVSSPDPQATLADSWQQWQIPFSDLGNVNLGSVAKVYIGVGDRDNPSAGGTGTIYVDDIGFGRPAAD